MRSEREVFALRQGWESDTAATIAAIQKECNTVFDRRKGAFNKLLDMRNSELPSHDGFCIMPSSQRAEPGAGASGSIWRQKPSSQSDIDRVLDETEAIVRSLTGVGVSA